MVLYLRLQMGSIHETVLLLETPLRRESEHPSSTVMRYGQGCAPPLRMSVRGRKISRVMTEQAENRTRTKVTDREFEKAPSRVSGTWTRTAPF